MAGAPLPHSPAIPDKRLTSMPEFIDIHGGIQCFASAMCGACSMSATKKQHARQDEATDARLICVAAAAC